MSDSFLFIFLGFFQLCFFFPKTTPGHYFYANVSKRRKKEREGETEEQNKEREDERGAKLKQGEERRNKQRLTGTLGSGDEGRTGLTGAPFPGPGEQNPDLVLRVRVQVPELVVGRVDSVGLGPAPRRHAVLHLLQDDGPVPEDGVGVELDQEVGRPDAKQLRRRDGPRGFWDIKTKQKQQQKNKNTERFITGAETKIQKEQPAKAISFCR